MGVIDRLAKVHSGPGKTPPSPVYAEDSPSAKRAKYIESIRWKGEIYCKDCGSTLDRVPVSTKWYEAPSFDPMTGAKLSFTERYGPTGLMVCKKSNEERSISRTMTSYRAPSFQEIFDKMEKPRHGMYYTDKPRL